MREVGTNQVVAKKRKKEKSKAAIFKSILKNKVGEGALPSTPTPSPGTRNDFRILRVTSVVLAWEQASGREPRAQKRPCAHRRS